ncbi:hypothetical protein JTE90_013405 [Oedothorax gibbosus]|uniref:Reverse transcriptase domain-containing protein n=1 Tax=Oedothorax gibbosus TaxID=931172 RepID=A0AAV6TV75_9ARAC|nr:hypothetical protein JTE90_013405 [Oedothorax gibbosus]
MRGSVQLETNLGVLPPNTPVGGGEDLMYPISIRELARYKIKYTSAAGPDGVTAKVWNKVPDRVKAKLFTIWVRVEPKLDSKQCGFRPRDGIAFCISQLDQVLSDTRNEKRGLCLVSLDLCKAFDSVSHQAIFHTLESLGLDKRFISYLRYVYGNGRTRLTYGGNESAPILPGRGVRQGDPLSPLIFNVVFDNVLRSVPDHLGLRCRGEWISKLAFADDLVLCAENAVDLQHVLDTALPVVRACGLKVNEQKSVSLTWLACGKDKRRIYDHRPTIKVENRPIAALGVDGSFKYLGVKFSPCGEAVLWSEGQSGYLAEFQTETTAEDVLFGSPSSASVYP